MLIGWVVQALDGGRTPISITIKMFIHFLRWPMLSSRIPYFLVCLAELATSAGWTWCSWLCVPKLEADSLRIHKWLCMMCSLVCLELPVLVDMFCWCFDHEQTVQTSVETCKNTRQMDLLSTAWVPYQRNWLRILTDGRPACGRHEKCSYIYPSTPKD